MNQPMSSPAVPPKASKQAIWSLVLGILSNTCLWLLGSIPAIILGISGMKKADADPQNVGGRGVALAGIITGSVGVFVGLFPVVAIGGFFAAILMPVSTSIQSQAEQTREKSNIRQIHLGLMFYAAENEGNFPPDLQTLVNDGILDDPALLKLETETGEMAEVIYRPGLNEEVQTMEPVLMSPRTWPDGRVVGHVGGAVLVLDGDELAESEAKFSR